MDLRRSFAHLAVCHLLLGGIVFTALHRRRHTAGLLLLGVGYGGIGAAWSRWTYLGGNWLGFGGARRWPDRQVVHTVLLHAPALIAGLMLLRRDLEEDH